MANRMYRDYNIGLDEIQDQNLVELIANMGQLYNISGLVLQGNEKSFLVMMPNASEINNEKFSIYLQDFVSVKFDQPWVFYLSVPELQALLKRSDDPLIFQEDETGTLKAIVRKSQLSISGAVQQQIWYRDGFQCMFCGKSIPNVQLTVDHWIPVEQGGSSEPFNLISCCRRCNKDKGNRDPQEYCQKHNLDYTGICLYLKGKAPKSFIAHLNK